MEDIWILSLESLPQLLVTTAHFSWGNCFSTIPNTGVGRLAITELTHPHDPNWANRLLLLRIFNFKLLIIMEITKAIK